MYIKCTFKYIPKNNTSTSSKHSIYNEVNNLGEMKCAKTHQNILGLNSYYISLTVFITGQT